MKTTNAIISPTKFVMLLFLVLGSFFSYAQSNQSQTKEGGFQISAQVGPGFRTAPLVAGLSAEEEAYFDELRSGLSIAVDGTFFISDLWGLGLQLNRYSAKASDSDGLGISGEPISNKSTITFIGPKGVTRGISANDKHVYSFGLGLGYMALKDEVDSGVSTSEITGSNIGLYLEGTYEFQFSKQLAVMIKTAFSGTSLSKVTVSSGSSEETVDLPNDQKENLSHLDIMGGFRLRF